MSNLAVVFPGQGSQSVGMLSELISAYPVVKDTFTEAGEVLGYDLLDLTQNGPAEELNKTFRTQPAILTASYAIWKLYQEKHVAEPLSLAGHSLGEYSALTCAGVLSFEDALRLVEFRGRAMQDAVPLGVGAMSAVIGLSDDAVRENCAKVTDAGSVQPANFNCPGQVVIAGDTPAVEKADALLKEAGAKKVARLAVSVPSHCPLMKPAADKLKEKLLSANFSAPKFRVFNNVDARTESDPEKIRDALVRQLCNPVRWTETVIEIKKLFSGEEGTFLEFGPGKVLTGLLRRIDRSLKGTAVNTDETVKEVTE